MRASFRVCGAVGVYFNTKPGPAPHLKAALGAGLDLSLAITLALLGAGLDLSLASTTALTQS